MEIYKLPMIFRKSDWRNWTPDGGGPDAVTPPSSIQDEIGPVASGSSVVDKRTTAWFSDPYYFPV
jgi:hypothetical protein